MAISQSTTAEDCSERKRLKSDCSSPSSSPSSDLENGQKYEKDRVYRGYNDEDDAESLALTHEQRNIEYYCTMDWKHTTMMLMLEYVCLAILNFGWIFNTLGLVIGLTVMVFFAFFAYFVGILMLEVCLKYPHVRDYCDFSKVVFGQSRFFYEFTFVCLILNNIFIQGMHVLIITMVLNTITNHALCTLIFAIIATIISITFSIPRTFSNMTASAVISAVAMLTSIVSTIIFAAKMKEPVGFDGTAPFMRAGPMEGQNFAQIFSALLNIIFTFMGHVCYPSFIYEMKNPKDFKISLRILCAFQIIVYTLLGVLTYKYLGQYSTAPAQGALVGVGKKISYSFVIIPALFIGVLYAVVAVKNIFFRIYGHTKHHYENTAYGWFIWILLLTITWAIGFFISILVPFFSSLVSLISALFNPFFGFIFPAVGYLKMRKIANESKSESEKSWFENHKGPQVIVALLFIGGAICFFCGLYSVGTEINNFYKLKQIRSPFSCADNSI